MKTEDTIRKQLAENPIILYMKGIPEAPECGFSAKTIGILQEIGVPFAFVNVLQAPFIRERLPKISRWPTYPQLFINGELIGGCDIVEEMSNDGSLQPLLEAAAPAIQEEPKGDVVSHKEVDLLVRGHIEGAKVFIEGEGCDLTITVISDKFAGLTLVKKQQLVLESVNDVLASGRLHAVSVKAFTVEEWQAKQAASNNGLLQIQA